MTDNKAWQDNNKQHKGFVAYSSDTTFYNSTTTSQLITIQQHLATIAMSNPNRGPGRPVPQLGAINNILQSPSRAPSRRALPHPGRHYDRQTRQHLGVRPREVQAERLQHQQTTNRDRPNTFRQHDRRQSRQTLQNHRYQQDHQARCYRNDRHSTTLPRKEERGSHDSTRAAPKVMHKHPLQTAASQKEAEVTSKQEPSPGKRKRKVKEDDTEAERDQKRRKHQAAHRKVKDLKEPLPRVSIDGNSGKTQRSDLAAKSSPNNKRHPVAETLTQLPYLPSSNATPERKLRPKKNRASTPAPGEETENTSELQSSPSAVTSRGTKRRRNDAADDVENPKKPEAVLPPMPTPTQNSSDRTTLQAKSVRKAHTRAVRPESSFAPVQTNHESELEFFEYLNDSVPILFSFKIQHSSGNTSLNNPPGMLVLDALTAIEKNPRLQSKGTWPSSIELTGRTPSKGKPVKVVDDVDLYLHEKDGKLHVATDRGLVAVSQYLKLIDVPEGRSVRFMGHVPPWAKDALNSRYTRKVVQIWGQDKLVKKDVPLEAHQVMLSLESHVEEARNRKKKAGVDHADDMNILDAGPGDLPLPFGSTVIVYKVDDDDIWAYGRLSGTDKTGRFPISYTCPMDWSLDRFACTDSSLTHPLPQSTGPDEEEWNGPFSWIKEKGFSEGPTWKETTEMTAAEAKAAKEVRLRFGKAKTSDNLTSTSPQVLTTDPALTNNVKTMTADPSAVDLTKAVITVEMEAAQSTHDVHEMKENPLVPAAEKVNMGERNPDTSITLSLEMPKKVAPEAARESMDPEAVDPVRTEPESETNVESSCPFSKPRCDPFKFDRNDDIEVDWSDSEL